MARLMSVAFTEQAVIERRKTVTRRKGWWENKTGRRLLVPGDRLTLCRKVMGRKKGEPLVRLADVEVVDVRRERLGEMLTHFALDQEPGYGEAEVALEGFPAMDPVEFVQRFFVVAQGISPADEVTRIEWRYLDKGSEDFPVCADRGGRTWLSRTSSASTGNDSSEHSTTKASASSRD